MADERMNTEKRGDACADCKFFEATVRPNKARSTKDLAVFFGICRRFPPTTQHVAQDGVWPSTCSDDWCGEHEGA